jgi:hypothetical protein
MYYCLWNESFLRKPKNCLILVSCKVGVILIPDQEKSKLKIIQHIMVQVINVKFNLNLLKMKHADGQT